MALEHELETYQRERPRLIAEGHKGRHVLIHKDELIGLFDSLDKALEAGYARFGLEEPFMVRQIEETDKVLHFTRNVTHVPRDRHHQ